VLRELGHPYEVADRGGRHAKPSGAYDPVLAGLAVGVGLGWRGAHLVADGGDRVRRNDVVNHAELHADSAGTGVKTSSSRGLARVIHAGGQQRCGSACAGVSLIDQEQQRA
jgi:hypothetical protein